jgi:hypothetical protein
MDHSRQPASEPPSSSAEVSFPARAFGYGTSRYRAFLEAIVDGLMQYEARKGASGHAPLPLPAA